MLFKHFYFIIIQTKKLHKFGIAEEGNYDL